LDFTLSAPKSVSLAWALADERCGRHLPRRIARRSSAFSFLEDEAAGHGAGSGAATGTSCGLAVACFVHPLA